MESLEQRWARNTGQITAGIVPSKSLVSVDFASEELDNTWTLTGTQTLEIEDGCLTLPDNGTGYAIKQTDVTPRVIGGTFSFEATGSGGTLCMLNNDETNFTAANLGMHLVITPTLLAVQYRENNGAFVEVYQHGYASLEADKVYRIEVVLDGDTGYIFCPDGVIGEFTAPQVDTLTGGLTAWEVIWDSGQRKGKWHTTWAVEGEIAQYPYLESAWLGKALSGMRDVTNNLVSQKDENFEVTIGRTIYDVPGVMFGPNADTILFRIGAGQVAGPTAYWLGAGGDTFIARSGPGIVNVGKLATSAYTAGAPGGSIIGKMPLYAPDGQITGYIPVYGS